MAVVGIDLGTTNTVVACVRGGRVHVLSDEQGRRLLPSVVSFHPGGEVLVGYKAKERRVVDARNTIASVKRLLGRSWSSDEIARARQRFPFELKEGPGHGPLVSVRGQDYTLPEISAFVLTRAKQIAERSLGERVERAVITVPANFNELQRAATKVAGRVAGLDVLRIINEPTAAALAYGLGRSTKERIAVYDFGGGTFDCTLLDLSGNVFEVLATSGDSFLGGDDVDAAIAERMAEAFLHAHRYDPRSDPQAFERLRAAAEAIKVELSVSERAMVKLREVAHGAGGTDLDLDFSMTRDELEMLATPLVERTFAVCQEALAIAKLPVTAFDKVILVGGSTRVPLVRRRVEQFFGSAPLDKVNADEVVAIGAAIQAAALTEVARRRSIPAPPVPASRTSLATEPEDEVTIANRLPAQIAELEKMRPPANTSPEVPSRRSAQPPAPLPVTLRMPTAKPPPGDLPSLTSTLPMPMTGPDAVRAALGREPGARPPTAPPLPSKAVATSTQPLRPPARPPVGPGGTQVMPAMKSPLLDLPSAPELPVVWPDPAADPAQTIPQPVSYADILKSTMSTEGGAEAPVAVAPVLVDVTPRALVVETVGGWCDTVVQRNAKIPCERTRAFTTSGDNQTAVRVRVAQGEDAVFERNTFLGEVELAGLRAAPRGEVTIRARFEVDESGTLKIFAIDVATGRQAHAVLQLVGIADGSAVEAMQARHAAARVS
ncbi:MAG TPA: Hsp70 family protein [Polyangiaceae bacterium]|jgi:molecular chaperone DnaK|nr:Hsp70 family protein [Polyangiaceae bacterium]